MDSASFTERPVIDIDLGEYAYKSEVISISPYCNNLQMVFLIEKIIKTIEKSMEEFKDLYGINVDGMYVKSKHYFKMFRNSVFSQNHGQYLMDEVNTHFNKIYTICNHSLIKCEPKSYFEIDNDWYFKVMSGEYLHESANLEQLEAIYEQLLMIDIAINGYICQVHNELNNRLVRYS